ncbi:hypothetical protein HPB48_003689 [Haemaphysalis longicornis]|uniref:Uncharacterized protein n=1 Tax=Haemaphysalis longicornis TaxID=44386 RepID=A0A9J6F7E5_HAELO|nr:hypothetical protein HPB48_003689 [Haemaphysalis longicornis]
MHQVPRFDEVCLMHQGMSKWYKDVCEMSATVQALKDEAPRELELFNEDLQKIKNEKGDYSTIVKATSCLHGQVKGNMPEVSEEFTPFKRR